MTLTSVIVGLIVLFKIIGGQEDEDFDYELVYLPILPTQNSNEPPKDHGIPYGFTAFGNPINLRLVPNKSLVRSTMKSILRDGNQTRLMQGTPEDCHFLHTDESTSAAFSFCDPVSTQGLLFLPNDTLEIHPLPGPPNSPSMGRRLPHLVKRVSPFQHALQGDYVVSPLLPVPQPFVQHLHKRASFEKMTIEIALFLDEAAYKSFSPYFNKKDEKIRDMLLAYINGVQALYHHPSLGRKFDLVLVHLELIKSQPRELPHFDGERGALLDSFCRYSKMKNPPGDSNPQHWDIGLYVTGLDMFAMEKGRKSGVTMGLATLGGACTEEYNCVVAEMGTTNVFGKPYVSAGFNSVYILAHEIGHNIGMRHDGPGEGCEKDGYIMSPSRGSRGETTWSACSAHAVRNMDWAPCLRDSGLKQSSLDQATLKDVPGQRYGAKFQCEFFLKDRDAQVDPVEKLEEICQDLTCRTPHRSGYYFAGPALTGTTCGLNKWCEGGSCVPARTSIPTIKGGWTEWTAETCRSGCINKGKGFQPRKRTCTNPTPVNTEEGCDGPSYDVRLCPDEKLCRSRSSPSAYATEKCKQFSSWVKELDPKASGLQAPHEQERLWMGCAIFCRRKGTGSYYTPRLDLNDLGVDPYFPDGTWCHSDGSSNYYCLQHHCLPENFIFVKEAFSTEDVPLPQNAPPVVGPLPQDILNYLSLDPEGRPVLTTLKPAPPPNEDDWADKDYMEIPQSLGSM